MRVGDGRRVTWVVYWARDSRCMGEKDHGLGFGGLGLGAGDLLLNCLCSGLKIMWRRYEKLSVR